jgi:hypothetical protein
MSDTTMLGTIGVIILILVVLGLIFLRRLVVRFFFDVLENPTGRIVLGALLCIGGLIFGFSSSFAPYQSLSPGSVSLLLPHINAPDDGNVYVQDLRNLGVYYTIHDADFSPQVDASVFQNGAGFTSLMYDGTTTQQIQTQLTSNFGPSAPIDGGTGYTVEQFSLNGTTFTTADYQANPEGVYQNHWPIGGAIAGGGLLLLLITLGLPYLSKRWEKASAATASPTGQTWSTTVSTPPPGIPYMPTPQPGGFLPPPNVPTPQPGGFLPPPITPTSQPGGFQPMPGMPTPQPGGFLLAPHMPAPMPGNMSTQSTLTEGIMPPVSVKRGRKLTLQSYDSHTSASDPFLSDNNAQVDATATAQMEEKADGQTW